MAIQPMDNVGGILVEDLDAAIGFFRASSSDRPSNWAISEEKAAPHQIAHAFYGAHDGDRASVSESSAHPRAVHLPGRLTH